MELSRQRAPAYSSWPCLIAQLTFTVTASVSSPGATAACGAAMGAAAMRPLNSGIGAPPSDTLSGAPSVTPVALA